jgi:ribonuclease R
MEAERDTIDRYVAAFLSERVGDSSIADHRVQPFGFFATVEGLGGDGLVRSARWHRIFRYDEATRRPGRRGERAELRTPASG